MVIFENAAPLNCSRVCFWLHRLGIFCFMNRVTCRNRQFNTHTASQKRADRLGCYFASIHGGNIFDHTLPLNTRAQLIILLT